MMRYLKTQMRWIMLVLVLAFLLSTFLMYDSGSRRGGSPSEGMRDYVVADVNGRRLMRSELEEQVRQYLEEMGSRELESTDLPYVYRAALDRYAMERQMDQEVKDSGITISDADVEQAMKDYADQYFPTREAFYQSLQRSNIRVEDYKRNIAQQMASQQLIQESIGTLTVSEDEAVEFYESTKTIFFRSPGGFNVNLANFASRDEAEYVRALLLDGEPWDTATSGDLAASLQTMRVTTGTFVPDSALDGYLSPMKPLKVGAVSPVFEVASDDFAVGVKSEAIEEKTTPYDEVSADLHAILQQQKEREAMTYFSQGLLSRARVVIRDPELFPPVQEEVLPVTEVLQPPEEVLPSDGSPISLDIPDISSDVSLDAAPAVVVSGD
jgi:hypothetical protein